MKAAAALWGKLRDFAGFRLFAGKSERDFVAMALTGAVFLLPFSLNHLVQGRLLLGSVTTGLVLWYVVHGVAVSAGRRLAPPEIVFLPTLPALAMALWKQGEVGIFWAYPAVLLFHFVLERRIANLYNATVVTMAVLFAYATFSTDVTLRVAATLVLTIVFANVFSYLTERQQHRAAEQERQLELERDRLALLVHATQAGFTEWDAEANVVIYSNRFKEMLGHSRDADTTGWPPFFELMHPEDRPGVQAEFRAMLKQKHGPGLQKPGQALDYRLRRADGSYVWVHAESIAQGTGDGRVRRFITSYQDISKFREQESRLLTEQKRLELVVRAGNIGILDWDGRSRTAYYSRRFKEILGYAGDADTSSWPDYFDMIHPDDRFRVQKRFRSHVVDQRAEELHEMIQYRLRRADGSYIWVEAVGVSVRDERGFVTRFIASIRDISERREQESRLRDQIELTRFEQRRLDLVVRAAQVGIVDWNGHSHETFYSPRFREILGYPPDTDTSDWPDYFKVLIHPEDRERIMGRWRDFILGKGPEGPLAEDYSPEEYRLLRADGSAVWVQVSGVAVRDPKGFVTRWIAAITDITERRAHEEALRQSVRLREEVERMSRHDLKTPLNSVIAVSRLLREGAKLPREDDELLGIVERAGYRILNMVNLSLDLFRMEQGTYQFRPQAVDIADVARKVAADLHAQAEAKQVSVQLRRALPAAATAGPGPLVVRGEELLCYSMLANLVKNAVEAAPEGATVTVSFEREPAGEQVFVHVHNPGAVHEAVRERFFEKYASAGKGTGLGIGTYSARLMARMQEGDITMRTSGTQGTTVSVRLAAGEPSLAPSVEPGRQATPGPQLQPLSVLVVDDDEFNRLVLQRMLPSPPLRLATAVNGRAALDAAAREWPDVVFLDLEMPVMDGYEAARRLREKERTDGLKRCTIVAFSSNDEQVIVERALAAGCDHYLVKPATRQTLWALLSKETSLEERAPKRPARRDDPVLVDPDLAATVEAFRASRLEMLARMQNALAEGHRPAFRRLAHQVAGSCALYGFHWAAAECQALEAQAADGSPDALSRRAEAVRAHLAGVEVRLAEGEAVNMDKP